ncbi:MAG: glycosyltransferase family 39 protein [bacterium]
MLTRPAAADAEVAQAGGRSTLRRDLVIVFALAAALRLVAGLLLSGTYDYDEFILLTLSRQYAHGFHPYRDMLYFHPPGALLVGRALDPLTSLWWPAGRVFTATADSVTAVLTYVAARAYLVRRAALAAGFSYAASPLTLVAGVRVGPDPLIALLSLAGLCVLLPSKSRRGALVAGALLGLAIGTKYTAVLLLPAYFLAAPRRLWAAMALGTAGAFTALLAPYLSVSHAVLQETIVYQSGRGFMTLDERLGTAALYWLAATPLAVLGLRRRAPWWVVAGFLSGGALLVAPQVYYHYFVVIAPFAALLSAPLLASLRWPAYRTVLAGVAGALVWLTVIATADIRALFVTTGRFADVAPTVRILRSQTAPGGLILSDRYEYPFLAGRPPMSPYFWSVRTLVRGSTLEQQLPCAAAVVRAGGASSGYPQGLTRYLDQHYQAHHSAGTTVWVIRGREPTGATAGSGPVPSCERFVLVPRQPCLQKRCVPGRSMDEIRLARPRP